ncbi:hypothetical protein [Streptomyces genisteinicus]|uniref:Uncharacterized protein n=1 Tax=Streptomyces genisteinicus TaxID=2768068 RepID=A0A7H0I4Y2_9ACTN|nr:hypothetical protein [Streptomyces genisteinicus]QNP67848.1 hypothetical protein IAG43_33420 [Streptomyces genisteinicus]
MRITITIDQPEPEFQEKLLALLAEHAAHVEMDGTWTRERAEAYYRSLPSRARRIVALAIAGDGYVAAGDLRDEETTSLRGHSAALKRLLQRGALQGLWPESIQPPITPQGPGFGKVAGYAMDEDLVPVFFDALASVETEHEEWARQRMTQRATLEDAVRGSGDGTWDTGRAVTTLTEAGHQVTDKRARQILRALAAAGLLLRTDAPGGRAVYRRSAE